MKLDYLFFSAGLIFTPIAICNKHIQQVSCPPGEGNRETIGEKLS